MLYFICHTEPVRLTEHSRGTRKLEPKEKRRQASSAGKYKRQFSTISCCPIWQAFSIPEPIGDHPLTSSSWAMHAFAFSPSGSFRSSIFRNLYFSTSTILSQPGWSAGVQYLTGCLSMGFLIHEGIHFYFATILQAAQLVSFCPTMNCPSRCREVLQKHYNYYGCLRMQQNSVAMCSRCTPKQSIARPYMCIAIFYNCVCAASTAYPGIRSSFSSLLVVSATTVLRGTNRRPRL
mmetsp:Transcript_53316/g.88685  ORF Transcript_53316/g.88685 Transcript_53316/m.88685 type:complete len:234 (+) Transcript_53316:27-728(+)